MVQVTQSPFLQALGYAIINSLWQYALLWLLYYLITSFSRFSAHKLYVFALLCHLTGFIWFSGTLVYYYSYCLQQSDLPSLFSTNSYFQVITDGASIQEKVYLLLLRAEQFLPYLSLAYILLLVFMSAKTVQCYRQTTLIRTTGLSKAPVEWKLFTGRLAMQLGIKSTVRLFLSALVHSPVTVGFLKPLVLLPLSIVNNLSTEQVEAVLIHELAHIKRHDYIVNLLLSVVEIALFFNPFMQLLSKHIRHERENCCDDWVLQYQYNAASYAHALLKIATSITAGQVSMAIAAVDDNQVLLGRVKRMIEAKKSRVNYRQQLVALVSMTAIFGLVAWLTPEKRPVVPVAGTPSKTIQAKVEVAKTDNILFNPVFFLSKPLKIKMNIPGADATAALKSNIAVKVDARSIMKAGVLNERVSSLPGVTEPGNLSLDNLVFDSLKLGRELQALVNSNLLTAKDLAVVKAQVRRANIQIRLQRNNSWNMLVNADKIKSEVENAVASAKNFQVQSENRNVLSRSEKIISDQRNNKQRAEQEMQHSMKSYSELLIKEALKLKSVEIKLAAVDALNKLMIQRPAVIVRQNINVSPTYSYEYNEQPKSQLIIAPEFPVLPEYTEELENMDQSELQAAPEQKITEPKAKTRSTEKTRVKIKRLAIIHI